MANFWGTRLSRLAGSLFLAVSLAATASGQNITGSIAGTVTDASGAVVPNAKITIINTDTNQTVRTVSADSGGNYSAPLLPIGHYTVSAEAAGFKKASITAIPLNVNDKLTENFSLEVGEFSQEVTVQEAPVAVELQTAATQDLVSGTQVRELALNTRNYVQLVTLMPGVTTNTSEQVYVGASNPVGTSNQVSYSINGGRNTQNNWTIDGADNVDRGANLTLLNYPSVDAIAEFKVLRGTYTAEFGRNAGGQINVVTKSGSSAFHGGAYEFVRNNAFAANNWLNNANRVNLGHDGTANVPPLRYNDFGYTIGGPVYIPGVYNTDKSKTFFFWSQEFRRVRTSSTPQATLPTAAELQGNFSVPVCVASSGGTCTATSQTISNINPVAAAYIKDIFSKLPAPGPSNSIFTSFANVFDARQELIKIDHNFGPKLQLSGRYLNDHIPTTEPGGLFTGSGLPGVSTTSTNAPGHSVVVRATSTLSARLVNEIGYAYSYGAILSTPVGLLNSQNSPDIKVPLPYAVTLNRVPSLTLSGGSNVTTFGPYNDVNKNHNAFDNFTWIHGRHTLKFGGSVNAYSKTENAGRGNEGSFTIQSTPRPTGTAVFQQVWANFLLGNVSQFTQNSLDIAPDIRSRSMETYFQDDVRLRPNLTLNFGLRYSLFWMPYDHKRFLTNFNPGTYNPNTAVTIDPTTGLIIPGTGDTLNGMIINDRNSPYGNKVSDETYFNFGPRFGLSWDPFGAGRTSIRTGYGVFHDFPAVGFYELNIFQNPPYVQSAPILNTRLENPAAVAATVSNSPTSLRGTPLPYQTPYTQQWSFDIQHQITRSLILDAGYVGSKGTHLFGIVDINQVPQGLAYSSGLVSPSTFVTSATTPRLNALRPYKGYNAINNVETWFNSNYNALQVSVQKRFAGNSLFGLAYTFSKSLTDNQSDNSTAPQNTYNRRAEYGPATLDRSHVFSANYVLDLPFFRAQKGVAGHVLGGWELSGITQYGSGLPLTVTSALGTDPGGLGILGPSASSPRPDMVCGNPNSNAPHGVYQWFNPACFSEVPAGQLRPGNAGRGVVRGPGYGRWDMSLFKNFKIRETVGFQFRGEAFNVFNHPSPLTVNTSFGGSVYGRVTTFRDPRIIQLGLKFFF